MNVELTTEERRNFNALFLSELTRKPIKPAFVVAMKEALEKSAEESNG